MVLDQAIQRKGTCAWQIQFYDPSNCQIRSQNLSYSQTKQLEVYPQISAHISLLLPLIYGTH